MTRFTDSVRRCVVVALVALCIGCGKDSSPTAPTAVGTPTRVIGVNGNLAFGDVAVGDRKMATLTITNSGTAAMTVTGLSVSGGLAAHSAASWTSGQVPAGGSQTVTIAFEPTAAGAYSGVLTVNADHTSGTNSLPMSGTGVEVSSFSGIWTGSYIVERCDGTGSIQDLLCGASRGAFPAGSSLPIRLVLSQNGNNVSGTFALGQVQGVATGVVAGGVMTLQGTATNGQLTAAISSWSTRAQGRVMTGTAAYNLTIQGVPGVAVMVTRLGSVTK